MLQEAMPRRAIEVLESEVRNLADRIDRSLGDGIEAAALTGIERGLAELRGALHGLTPAENLAGLDRTVREVSRKVDLLAKDAHDPSALPQLEVAITMMRQVASRAASSEALANLSEEVRALARKVDQVAGFGVADTLSALEARIAMLADALERRVPLSQEAQASLPTPDVEPLSSEVGELPRTKPIESTDAQVLKSGGPHMPERGSAETAVVGKSSFIAAARRAAQAAGREAPETIALHPKTGRPAARKARKLRALATSAAALVLVLGSLQIATTLLNSGGDAATDGDRALVSGSIPADAQPTTTDAAAAAPAAEKAAVDAPTEDHTRSSAAEPSGSTAATGVPPTSTPALFDTLPAAFGSTLRMAAAKGDANAQHEVAVRYFDGRGVPRDPTAAAEWFGRAAGQGLAPAQFRLGGLYEKGLGVEKDLNAARRFYLAAGQAGHAKAMHNLAVLYAEGIDGKPDYQTAVSWFRKAAAYGLADSQYNLAVLYARGIGVEQNLTESYKWFALAAREGDMEAARKRDNLGARIDQPSLQAALQAVRAWTPQPQPDAAVRVETPVGGWDPVMPAR
jgi:localization factor PodJL